MQSLPSQTLWTAAWPNCSHDVCVPVCVPVCAVCVCVVSIKDNYYYTCNATINGIINASAHAQLRATFSGLHNFRKDEQNINRKSDRETDRATTSPGCGIIFDLGSISIALSLSLSQSTLRHAKPKQNTLCRPFVAPPRAFSVCSGNVQLVSVYDFLIVLTYFL